MGSSASRRRLPAVPVIVFMGVLTGVLAASVPVSAQSNGRVAAAAASSPETTKEPVTRVESAVAAGGIATTSTLAPRRVIAGLPTASDVIANPRITLTAIARDDLDDDLIDSRILAVLQRLSRSHTITVSVLVSGHSRLVKGTDRVSNHISGRAVDIIRIDATPVSATSDATYDALNLALALPPSLRPDEIGGPWDVDGGAGLVGFTDNGHRDHIHLGFDD